METLKTHFTKNGFTFEQIKRTGNVAIYKKTKPEHQFYVYEVIVIEERKPCELFGKLMPATEIYPSSEQWGANGFTAVNIAKAESKMEELIKHEHATN
jgi:hypothetical protein